MNTKKRCEIINQLGAKCSSCGLTNFPELVVDHILPTSKGGENKIENFQILCLSCNASKGNRNANYSHSIPKATCKKCEYTWLTRIDEPRMCPACKSRYWNAIPTPH